MNNKNTRRVRKGKTRAAVADDAHEVVVEADMRLDSKTRVWPCNAACRARKTYLGTYLQLFKVGATVDSHRVESRHMHCTRSAQILTNKKTNHDLDMNNTSCQILRATRVLTATTRIGEGPHDTCLLEHQCASSASQRVKENNRSFAQRWLEKTERPEPLTVCSTLGCRCAFSWIFLPRAVAPTITSAASSEDRFAHGRLT